VEEREEPWDWETLSLSGREEGMGRGKEEVAVVATVRKQGDREGDCLGP